MGKSLSGMRERGAGKNYSGAEEEEEGGEGEGRESLSAPTEWHCRSVLRIRTLHASRCSQSTDELVYRCGKHW